MMTSCIGAAGSAFPSEVADVGAAARAVVLVDHAAVHAERDEAAAQVAPDQAEAQAPKPGFGTGAAVALHAEVQFNRHLEFKA